MHGHLLVGLLAFPLLAAAAAEPAAAQALSLSAHSGQAEVGAVLDGVGSMADADPVSDPADDEALAFAVVTSQPGNLGARASGLARSSFDPPLVGFELRAERRVSLVPGGDATPGSATASLDATQRLVVEGPVRLGFAATVVELGFAGSLDVTLTNQTTGQVFVTPAATSRRLALPAVRRGDVLEFTATGSATGFASGSDEERYIHTAFLHVIEPHKRCELGQLSAAQRFCQSTLRCFGRWIAGKEGEPERDLCLDAARDGLAESLQQVLDRAAAKGDQCPDTSVVDASLIGVFYDSPVGELAQETGATSFVPATASADERKARGRIVKEAAKACDAGFKVEGRLSTRPGADATVARTRAKAKSADRIGRALDRAASKGVDLTGEVSPTSVTDRAFEFALGRGQAARGGF